MAFEPSPWHTLPWSTEEPVELPADTVHAAGVADVQVRNAARLAALGDLPAQQAHVQGVILASFVQALTNLQPSRVEIAHQLRELASLTLVTANTTLGVAGVLLLDLTILEITHFPVEEDPSFHA